MSWKDRDWRYNDAATTARPGYLKRRFTAIRKEQKDKLKDEAEHRIETALKIRKIR